MLRISFQTLRARRGTLAGAFIAIWLAVTLAYGTGLLMDGALSAPGPGRFAAAEAVLRAKPADPTMPAPRLDAALVARVDGGIGDVSFPVGAWSGRRRRRRLGTGQLHAHGWASAALTPYRLTSGRAPSGPRELVADERLAAGARVRVATPAGEATFRVTGTVRGAAGPATLFFADRTAARLSGTRAWSTPSPPRPGTHAPSPDPRGARPRRTRPTPTPATPAPPTARRSSRSSARWAGSPARSRCSSSPARSRSPSPSGGARSPCCARSARRRIRSGG